MISCCRCRLIDLKKNSLSQRLWICGTDNMFSFLYFISVGSSDRYIANGLIDSYFKWIYVPGAGSAPSDNMEVQMGVYKRMKNLFELIDR